MQKTLITIFNAVGSIILSIFVIIPLVIPCGNLFAAGDNRGAENNRLEQANDFSFEKNKLFLSVEQNLERNRYNTAQKLLDAFKAKYPDAKERKFYFYSAVVNEQRGEFLAAADNYKKAIALYPAYSQARNSLGCLYLKLEKYAEAEEQLLKAVEANPYSPFMNYNLGDLYFRTGKYDEAEKSLLKACKYKANYGEAYDKLGRLMFGRRDYSKAIEYFARSVEFKYSTHETYYYMGLSHDKLGQTEQAISNFTKSINVKKDFYAGFLELGKIHKIFKEYKEAIKYFLAAESIDYEDSGARILIAECYYEMKRYDDAFGALEAVSWRDKDNKEVLELYAKIRKDITQAE